jgi:hypothetical protein
VEVDMTLQLTEEQRRAVKRGEPVRLKAGSLGEIVLQSANVYDKNLKPKNMRAGKKMPKISNTRLKALAEKFKAPQSWYDEEY